MIILAVAGLFVSVLTGLASMLFGMGVRLLMMTAAGVGAILIVMWILSR